MWTSKVLAISQPKVNATGSGSKRDVITNAWRSSANQDKQELMPLVFVKKHRMNVHAVKHRQRRDFLREVDVQPGESQQTILKTAVCDTNVRRNRQSRLAFQTFAQRGVKRLPIARADAVGACPNHQRRA